MDGVARSGLNRPYVVAFDLPSQEHLVAPRPTRFCADATSSFAAMTRLPGGPHGFDGRSADRRVIERWHNSLYLCSMAYTQVRLRGQLDAVVDIGKAAVTGGGYARADMPKRRRPSGGPCVRGRTDGGVGGSR